MSSHWDKVVKLACKPKSAAPKAKYLDPIIATTYSEDGSMRDVFAALAVRLRDPSTVIIHKALLVIHTMIRAGQTDNVLGFLSSSNNDVIRLRNFASGHGDGHSLSENLSSYAAYIEARIRAYRDLRHDTIRIQNENNREDRMSGSDRREGGPSRNKTVSGKKLRQITVEKGLLRETKGVQRQIDSLLQCKFFLDNLEDELTLTTLTLLVKDLLILFQAGNEGVINVLEHYFEMSAVDAEQSLAIYKSFCTQTESVVEYLSIARKLSNLLNVPVPNLRHAPTKLAGALEEYLRDPNFEQNRIEYKTNKALADGKIPNKAKAQPRQEETKADPESSKSAQASASASTSTSATKPRPPSIQPTIDFLQSIEESQPTMFNPVTNSPSTSWFQANQQQPMMTGYNPFRQSTIMPQMTGMPTQPFMMGQPTGAAPPFAQSTLQPQMTGLPFPNALSPFPQTNASQNPFPTSGPPMPFQQPIQTGAMQPQPTGFLQPQQTGFNPFRQSMVFPSSDSMPQFPGLSPSPQSVQPRSASAISFSVPSGTTNPNADQFKSQSPFAAALINRPQSTPISGSGQTIKPLVAQQTGSRNPFGQLKAPSPPPVPKPPTLAELSWSGMRASPMQSTPTGMLMNGANGTSPQPAPANTTNLFGQQPFSSQLATALGNNNSPGPGNMSSVASAFALPQGVGQPAGSQSPAPSQITTQPTSTSTFSDAFSSLSLNTSTGTAPSSVMSTPLQPQATGLAGLKTFKPTSSFGASLVESLPPANAGNPTTNINGNSSPFAQVTTNPTGFGQNNMTSSLTAQPTGISAFSPGQGFGSSLFSGAGATGGLGSTVGVGLRPQMTGGGAANPFRASTAAGSPFGATTGLQPMPTGLGGFSQTNSLGSSLFSPGTAAFKPTLTTIPSFTGPFPTSVQPSNQQQQQSASLI